MNAPRIETAEVGRAMGRVLSERNTWRHVVNRIRSYLDLPALDTEGCSEDDSAGTVEAVWCVVRDSDALHETRRKLAEAHATIDRMGEQARTDRSEIAELLQRVAWLESMAISMGGEP